MESQREQQTRQRRRQLLLLGVALSLCADIILMLLLTIIHRPARGGTRPQPVSYEFAIVQEEELSELQDLEFADLVPESVEAVEDLLLESEPALDATTPAPELEMTSSSGALPSLGGAGGGDGGIQGLEGGAAGTSFFGIASQGTRFAYVVDISGSMRQGRKLPTAMRELGRSISALPDFAHFYVVLFRSEPEVPPMQRGWSRARPGAIRTLIRWLEQVTPEGGTRPETALAMVFNLDVRPDVVFFLTDGEIPAESADIVAALNSRSRPVVVNTIAFGDESSQELLKRIAKESGGAYRFVPSE